MNKIFVILKLIWFYIVIVPIIWIANNKSAFGGYLFLMAMVIQKLAEIWIQEPQPSTIPKLIETLQWAGGLFTGVGIGHKGVRSIGNALRGNGNSSGGIPLSSGNGVPST